MSFPLFKRLARHLFILPSTTRRYFPAEAMRRIEAAIAENETKHTGEIRFAVETNLHMLDILRKKSARQRAIEIFSHLRIWDTEQNNGVLIYLLLADHDFEILADRGIHHHTGTEGWERVSLEMEKMFRQGQFETGALYGIQQIGHKLSQHYPANGKNKNELSDAPIII
ncbi:MAG: TPM domain-containing protein [Methylotenera sp.]|nr:TPM domain-containing protein [Methylotenera sp.]